MKRASTAFAICIVFFGVLSAMSRDTSSANGDRLVKDDLPRAGTVEAEYSALVEKELYVTRGDLARFVQTPGPLNQPEIAVALDQDANKSGYTLTATKPTKILAPFALQVRSGVKSWRVLRATAPLPKSTALAVHELWLTMLRQARRWSPPNYGEATWEEFSAVGPDGNRLLGAAAIRGDQTWELDQIGFLLFDYCYVSVSHRPKTARKIEMRARSLRAKVLKHQ